jgi:diaminopimelate epimerase
LNPSLIRAATGIPFLKVSGGGNDFVLIDNRNSRLRGSLSELVRRIAHRGLGVGADGVILAEWSHQADLKMVYMNSDGSTAALCGNGLRCLARWAAMTGTFQSPMLIETGAGVLEADGAAQPPWITLPLGKVKPELISLSVQGDHYEGVRIHAGIPHLVIQVNDLYSGNLMGSAPALRFHSDLGPEGANIDFFSSREGGMLDVRYYERGIEAETLSSGTGSIAVAVAARKLGICGDTVTCRNVVGLESTILLKESAAGLDATLAGDVRVIFNGRLQSELLESQFPAAEEPDHGAHD